MRKLFLISFVLLSLISSSQVNLQTGSATFSLPMFNWQDDRSRLNAVVALNYNSGNGLRVNDIATSVGTGWNLVAGGVITRVQAGEPDDQKAFEGDGTLEDERRYPNGILYNTEPFACPKNLIWYPIFRGQNNIYKPFNKATADRELDQFTFTFNGVSGTFFLCKNCTSTPSQGEGVMIGHSNLKVWFEKNENLPDIRTTIVSFYIQDENGLIYKFSKYETTEVLKVSYCDDQFARKWTQVEMKDEKTRYESSFELAPYKPHVINSWYLAEIKDALTNRVITYKYDEYRNISASYLNISYYKKNIGDPLNLIKGYSIISKIKSNTFTPILTAIEFPDLHKVTFNYGSPRVDLPGDKVLASIDVTYNSRFLSRYLLTTGYFILNRYGNPTSDYQKQCARLCLLAIQKYGVDLKASEEPYRFDYFLGSSSQGDFVPPPFFHFKDIWGYYNGDNSRDYYDDPISFTKPLAKFSYSQLKGLCFLRFGTAGPVMNPKDHFAQNGLLKSITYPTGGTLMYEYEQNRGKISNGAEGMVGGVHVKNTKVVDGGYSNDCDHPLVTNYTYTLGDPGNSSSLWGLETPVNSITTFTHYAAEEKRVKYKPPFGVECYYKYEYPGILSKEQSISLTSKQQAILTLSKVMNVVGAVTEVLDIINFCANGTGVGALIADLISSILSVFLTCGDRDENYFTGVFYNTDLNSSNPLPAQFKRVEVIEGSGSSGKTVYEFTDKDYYALWVPENQNTTFAMEQRFGSWAYGLPLKTTVVDAAGNKVKDIENVYNIWAAYDVKYIASCKCLVLSNSSMKLPSWTTLNQDPDYYYFATHDANNHTENLQVRTYFRYSGRAELTDTYERDYKKGNQNQWLTKHTQYFYNNFNLQVSQVATTQSNGDVITKYIKYSKDYSTGVLATLNDNNIVTAPVSRFTTIKKAGTTQEKYLGESVTEYTTLQNGGIKPLRTLVQRFDQPQTTMATYMGPGNTANPSYKEVQSLFYNNSSILSGMKDEGNRMISNIYDFSDKYVVASVVNADPILDKSAYTSFETSTLGGWTLNGNPVYGTNYITGKQSLLLTSSNSLTAPLNTNKTYIISFWSTTALSLSGGAVMLKSAPQNNQFTYYEYRLPAGPISVTITGNANMDELRLYPESARMRTVSYDPLINKTSECDENNRLIYYEYDELGRLRFIKDDNRNVVKMYEYNTMKRQIGCETIYYNKAISEVFIRNCGPGYQGGEYTYTVPANKYSSTIGQWVVDMLAQKELDQSGQAFADADVHTPCYPIFLNVEKSKTFTRQCEDGYAGSTINYIVPAGTYSSIISQEDADQKALDDIYANGQAKVNKEGTCTLTTVPDWILTGQEECRLQHKWIQEIDINPNSPGYNQTRWTDTGYDPACTYGIDLPNGCSGISSIATVSGNAGDVIVLKLSFGGVVQRVPNGPATGASMSMNVAGQFCTNATPHYNDDVTHGFSLSCTITFTMSSNSATVNTQAVLNNTTMTSGAAATLEIVSVNGVPKNMQKAICSGNSSGAW